jgi:hypothetical protein
MVYTCQYPLLKPALNMRCLVGHSAFAKLAPPLRFGATRSVVLPAFAKACASVKACASATLRRHADGGLPALLPACVRAPAGEGKCLFKIGDQVIRVFEAYIKTDHFMSPVACIEVFR